MAERGRFEENRRSGFLELLEESRKRVEAEDMGADWQQRAVHPVWDSDGGQRVTYYLRQDVIQWLKEEAKRRKNGWSPSRIIVELIRERMENGTQDE